MQALAIVMTVASLAGCATQKPSGKVEDVIETRATVTAIDQAQRHVTLQDITGNQIVVQVADSVKRLNEVKVGDDVVIKYTEAVAWQVKPASQGKPGVDTQESVTRAKPDEQPGATVGRKVTLTTTITAIDLTNGTVTLTGPNGASETFKARDPANLKKVQIGDLVDIVYTEAVALSLQPAAKK
jgi:Cu/Ag efflux protein CusF